MGKRITDEGPFSTPHMKDTCCQLGLSQLMLTWIAWLRFSLPDLSAVMLRPPSCSSLETSHCAQPTLKGWEVILHLLESKVCKVLGIFLYGRFTFSSLCIYLVVYTYMDWWIFCVLRYDLIPSHLPCHIGQQELLQLALCTFDVTSLFCFPSTCFLFGTARCSRLILCILCPSFSYMFKKILFESSGK